ncbi:hypothetical protein HAX54_013153, partial [Datura stramonium]|nr:hypothetical protein [Datura stramonium]
ECDACGKSLWEQVYKRGIERAEVENRAGCWEPTVPALSGRYGCAQYTLRQLYGRQRQHCVAKQGRRAAHPAAVPWPRDTPRISAMGGASPHRP